VKKSVIISVGTEHLHGEITDTNGVYASADLHKLGVEVIRRIVVGDNEEELIKALKNNGDVDLLVILGGLGPTRDDMTKSTVADYFSKKLVRSEKAYQNMKRYCSSRNISPNETIEEQSLVPEGSIVFENIYGTACGFAFEENGTIIALFPGPRNEFKYTFDGFVHYLEKELKIKEILFDKKIYFYGIGEYTIAKGLDDIVSKFGYSHIATYVHPGEVELRISLECKDEQEFEERVSPILEVIKSRFDEYIGGYDDKTAVNTLGEMLKKEGHTISVAESVTGGKVAGEIISVPGSSTYFKGGLIVYTDEVKKDILKVDASILSDYGAVSAECAKEMALRVRELFHTPVGLSTTGYAGPDGGTPENPIGTVYIAVNINEMVSVKKYAFPGDRNTVRERASKTAIFEVIRALKNWCNYSDMK